VLIHHETWRIQVRSVAKSVHGGAGRQARPNNDAERQGQGIEANHRTQIHGFRHGRRHHVSAHLAERVPSAGAPELVECGVRESGQPRVRRVHQRRGVRQTGLHRSHRAQGRTTPPSDHDTGHGPSIDVNKSSKLPH